MNILITGGAGFIGSFMTKRLLDDGHTITVVDNLSRGHKSSIDARSNFIEGDLLDRELMSEVFKTHFDGVIHFAGLIAVSESMEKPYLYFKNNVYGTLELLEKMRESGVDSILFSSTGTVYGDPEKVPIPESHPKLPTNPYSESKLIVEKILSWYEKIHGIHAAALRYFNAAGAALDGSMGEAHNPETHLIPNAIKSAIASSQFTLYGNDYHTEDGTCVRDYIHVLDLVEAHVLALNKLKEGKAGFSLNVGTGNGYTNKQVLEMVKEVSGVDFPVKTEKRRAGDSEATVADVTEIKKLLNFEPKHSSLKEIIETAYKWHVKSSSASLT